MADKMAVLIRHVKDLNDGIRYGESIIDMDAAVAAVAELLAADEELDDSRIAACQTSILTPLPEFPAVMDRFYAAQQRRAAAILAMREG